MYENQVEKKKKERVLNKQPIRLHSCVKKKNLYGPEAPHQLSTLPGSTQLEGFCLCE